MKQRKNNAKLFVLCFIIHQNVNFRWNTIFKIFRTPKFYLIAEYKMDMTYVDYYSILFYYFISHVDHIITLIALNFLITNNPQ